MDAMKKDVPKAFSNKNARKEALIEDWKAGELDQEQAEMFTAAMHSHSLPTAMGVAKWGDFTGVKRLLDIGGGSGCFCIALAMHYPEMLFTVIELEAICPVTKRYIAEFGLEDRIDTRAVDIFREPWPTGYDAIFMSHIFHDWDLAHCYHLAHSSFEALPSGGRIYLHEILINDTKDGPLPAISYSMQMIAFTKGKQLTADELENILSEVGFKNMSIIPTFGYHFLISAEKP